MAVPRKSEFHEPNYHLILRYNEKDFDPISRNLFVTEFSWTVSKCSARQLRIFTVYKKWPCIDDKKRLHGKELDRQVGRHVGV
jgi:hypothetical protein